MCNEVVISQSAPPCTSFCHALQLLRRLRGAGQPVHRHGIRGARCVATHNTTCYLLQMPDTSCGTAPCLPAFGLWRVNNVATPPANADCPAGDIGRQIEKFKKANKYIKEDNIWSYAIQIAQVRHSCLPSSTASIGCM